MNQGRRDWAVVVEEDGAFLGWVNRHELGDGERVVDITVPPSTTGTEDTVLNEALSLMLMTAIGNLAVVDKRNRLQGVLTFQSIRKVLGELYTEAEEDQTAESGSSTVKESR